MALIVAWSHAADGATAAGTWILPNGPAQAVSPQGGAVGFNGSAGDRISLLTQPVAGTTGQCYSVTITAPGGASLYGGRQCGAADFSDALVMPTSGRYAIQLSGSGAQLALFSVPPDIQSGLIANGPASAATISAPGQGASFAFGLARNEQVSLVTQLDGSLAQQCANVRVLAPDRQTELYNRQVCGAADFAEGIVAPAAGLYSVRVKPVSFGTGVVRLSLLRAHTDNKGKVKSGSVVFPAIIDGSGNTLRFNFAGTAGTRVSLLTEADSPLRRECLAITVVAPDLRTQVYQHSQCGNPDFTALALSQTGNYSIALTPLGNATGKATITLFHVPPDSAGATTIGGPAVPLATVVPGQGLQTRFPGTAGQTADIAINADAGLASQCYEIALYAPTGTTVFADKGCGPTYSSGPQTLPVMGVYAVAIASVGIATGTASVSVSNQ
ncbi:MAG TPA: hypothetical protein VM782_09365 [Stellaceae bacterium]|nr:hypothetical protein [Stellaceae bacterium]